MPKNNNHTIPVDDEVFSIISGYAAINGCSHGEAVRRLVLNAREEQRAESDGIPKTTGTLGAALEAEYILKDDVESFTDKWYLDITNNHLQTIIQ